MMFLIEFNTYVNGHSGGKCKCRNYNCWWYKNVDSLLFIHKLIKKSRDILK